MRRSAWMLGLLVTACSEPAPETAPPPTPLETHVVLAAAPIAAPASVVPALAPVDPAPVDPAPVDPALAPYVGRWTAADTTTTATLEAVEGLLSGTITGSDFTCALSELPDEPREPGHVRLRRGCTYPDGHGDRGACTLTPTPNGHVDGCGLEGMTRD